MKRSMTVTDKFDGCERNGS